MQFITQINSLSAHFGLTLLPVLIQCNTRLQLMIFSFNTQPTRARDLHLERYWWLNGWPASPEFIPWTIF